MASSVIGSVFLGDVQRHRLLSSSSSTPPSSPPPHISPSTMSSLYDLDLDIPEEAPKTSGPPPSVPPVLSLDLRIRWLEALLYGAQQDGRERGGAKAHELKKGETLMRRAEELQRKVDGIVQSNDGLKKFMEHYDQHAHLLTPAFALSGTLPTAAPTYENMSLSELEAFLVEMEPDIRAADRDLREISLLESKGVTGAGKLADYKILQPRLEALVQAHTEDLEKAADLEKRIAALMDRYATSVDTLSELFVAWDDAVREAEDHVAKLERDREERRRLGYE
ncbi:hypothetical protein BKA93DRAFT_816524 [Sparassis latifolia]|uniref:Uncharacterized protein n=1 Tax=Sparassis crispa TaxID=139825 RepID=A0A401GWW2_9APHY|nr:hypothetical protein SCP_0901330 [Sparassis crispa]GBE86254.1 hypothetical protein SCP_0901330 [Sparassis crispa]